MIANAMTTLDDCFGVIGIAFNVLPNEKKGGGCVVLFQNIEQFKRMRRGRIIKGEVKRIVRFAPKALRKKPIGNFWNTLWVEHDALGLGLSKLLQSWVYPKINIACGTRVAMHCQCVCTNNQILNLCDT